MWSNDLVRRKWGGRTSEKKKKKKKKKKKNHPSHENAADDVIGELVFKSFDWIFKHQTSSRKTSTEFPEETKWQFERGLTDEVVIGKKKVARAELN